MARDVIDRLDLRGDERVLDAGCGSGRVTEELLARVPNGTVIAVDGSQAMVDQTRERLGERVEAFAVDLLDLDGHPAVRRDPLDRHLPLDRRPRAPLRPPARGAPPGWPPRRPVRRRRQRRQRPGGDRRRRPSRAARVGRPVELRDARAHRRAAARGRLHRRLDLAAGVAGRPAGPARVLRHGVLGSHLERLPAGERMPFVDAVLAQIDEPVRANYVRLNLLARR